jgi:hypothetical protein
MQNDEKFQAQKIGETPDISSLSPVFAFKLSYNFNLVI